MNDERMKILEMVEQGTITSAQAAELLFALEENNEDEDRNVNYLKPDPSLDAPPPSGVPHLVDIPDPNGGTSETRANEPPRTPKQSSVSSTHPSKNFSKWRNWWYYPLTFGILITIFSGWLLFLGNQNEWAGFWMACIWLPLLLGISVILLSWLSHSALWAHVRVNTAQDEWPRRIAISLPLPLRLGAWIFRTFQDKIPGIPDMDDVPLDELITAILDGVKPDAPIYIEIEEGKGGERVEVYIG